LDDKKHWYKDAIIYELHIKAFFDSDNNGIGDFGGLIQKLDYLQDLGITAVWVLPFYPSPLRDDGYDVMMVMTLPIIIPSIIIMETLNSLNNF
jgi:maltose alpha-D-glucosyltransferase / alpha-amylase